MSWRITTDHLETVAAHSAVGTVGGGPLNGRVFSFRLLDGDGELYYTGLADQAAMDDDLAVPGGLFEAYRWGQENAGVTDLQVRDGAGWVSMYA